MSRQRLSRLVSWVALAGAAAVGGCSVQTAPPPTDVISSAPSASGSASASTPPGSAGTQTSAAPAASTTAGATAHASASPSLPAAYLAAVQTASHLGPADAIQTLMPLKAGTPGLQLNADGTAATMVTLTTWTGYADSVGNPMTLTREVWLTPAPQLKDFCTAYVAQTGGADPGLRMLQYLGMPPQQSSLTVATMMVPLDDMFRPAPDPRIDTTGSVFADPASLPANPAYPNYADWYRLQKALAYDPGNPYPWTGLGWTYDWGDPDHHVGASEYVVRQGSTVEVLAAQTPMDYCTS